MAMGWQDRETGFCTTQHAGTAGGVRLGAQPAGPWLSGGEAPSRLVCMVRAGQMAASLDTGFWGQTSVGLTLWWQLSEMGAAPYNTQGLWGVCGMSESAPLPC